MDDTPPRGYDDDRDDLAAALDFSRPTRAEVSDLDALGGYMVGYGGADTRDVGKGTTNFRCRCSLWRILREP